MGRAWQNRRDSAETLWGDAGSAVARNALVSPGPQLVPWIIDPQHEQARDWALQTNPMELTMRVRALAAAAAFCVAAGPAAAQQTASPAAAAADVESIDAIIAAVYDVISGPAGQARDWDRFRSLFVPGARLIPTGRAAGGEIRHRVMTPDEYATTSGPVLEERGFFESEIGRTTEQFGNIAHAFSAYDSKNTLADPEPFARGINSIQLFHDGSRWWIVSIFWDSETPDNPIPARYLGEPR
jgi:hypothetical protein